MISAKKALQIAMEDPETILFIQTAFSRPEDRPLITSRRWFSEDDHGDRWNIELMEKNLPHFSRREDLINVALIEIHSHSGEITDRYYFAHILLGEYEEFLSYSLCRIKS
ncbi:MAG: hypothetical protein ACE5L7_05800 [Candidatus Aminicenantales bacterium]